MNDDVAPDTFAKGAVVKHFNAEYTPLEAFLACLIDAQSELASPPSRQTRIREAFKCLTDVNSDRIDDPSGKHARALYRMAEYQYAEYVGQLLPEFGGPPADAEPVPEDTSISKFAQRARIELDLPESDEEILRKKYLGTYGKDPKAKTETYSMLPIDRLNSFDSAAEQEMLNDFRMAADILSKYGIDLEFKTVFWRTVGKVGEFVPNT